MSRARIQDSGANRPASRPPAARVGPKQLGKVLTPEEREQMFFKDDQGKLWYNAGNHFGNYFDPIRLDGFAKIYMDDSDAEVDQQAPGFAPCHRAAESAGCPCQRPQVTGQSKCNYR